MMATVSACGGSVEPTGDGTGSTDPSTTSANTTSGAPEAAKTGGASGGTTSNGPDSAPPTANTCTYPANTNPPECPPAYTRRPPPSCASVGLKCWYPGAGDGDGHGCWSTALLACVGGTTADGGVDATGHWVGAQ